MTNAVLVPCLIAAPRGLAVTIHFGTPVPDDLLADPARYADAAGHAVRELLPLIRALPEQCVDQLLSAFGDGG